MPKRIPKRALTLWDGFWSEPDTHLEKSVALLQVPRLLLLLPFEQAQFSPRVTAFTALIPQQVWGLWALFVLVRICLALRHSYNHRARSAAMSWAGAHWLCLAVLYLMGEWRASAGWFFLLLCLLPLAVIVRLSPAVATGGAPDGG